MPYTPVNTLPTQLLNQRPIGFADDIASLGNLIDAIQARRQQQANQDREFELKQQRFALDDQKAAELDARAMRGQRVQWSRDNQKAIAEAQGQAATGLPRSFVHVDDQGNPQIVTPTYEEPQASPAPVDEGPQDINTMLTEFGQPSVQSSSSKVSGAQYSLPPLASMDALSEAELEARTKDAQMREQPAARRVRIPIPGQEPIVVDQGQVREDAQRQASFEVSNLQQALQDPNLTEGAKRAIEASIAAKRGMLPTKMQQTVLSQAGSTDRNLDTLGTRTDIADADRSSRESIAKDRNATAITLKEMSRKKGPAGKLVAGRAAADGSEFNAFASKDPLKAARIASAINTEVKSSLRNMNWDKLEGTGTDRLDMALRTMKAGGAGEFEAMINFFGYIRGGVPAKNETDEWHRMTDTAVTKLDSFGQKIGLGALGTLIARRDLTADERKQLKAKVSGIPPQQKAELIEAIVAAKSGLQDFANKATDSIALHFKTRPPMHQELVQGKIDELRNFSGLPPKEYFKAGGTAPSTGGKMSDEQLLKALQGMK